MEARFLSIAVVLASLLSLGASYRTQNFIISAPTPEFARAVGDAGEIYRRDLALEWLGRELPPWSEPCPIRVHVGPNLGAGGATSFMFDRGRPFGWQMTIQGSEERVLDSVLPHEITHMVFATHFGRPLPRWADEGACTTVEHDLERRKQDHLLIEFLTTGRGIAFNQMFAMQEYPDDILPLYSQGYSLARFLIAQGGKRKFVDYVGDGMKWNNWTAATKHHYGYGSLSELQVVWLDWVRQGSPPLAPQAPESLLPPPPLPAAQVNGLAEREQGGASPSEFQFASSTPAVAQPDSGVSEASSAASSGGHTTGSWYARQRDLAQSSRQNAAHPVAPASPRRADDPSPGQARSESGVGPVEPLVQSSLARPQAPSTMQPTVIQWQSSPPPPLVPLPAQFRY